MSETRTKKFKQYRSQIKKEASINEKLKRKNNDIEAIKKKVSKIDEDFFLYDEDQIFSSIYFVLPQISNKIKDVQTFLNLLEIESLGKEFDKMMGVGNTINEIIKDNGLINKKYFENDSTFSRMDNFNSSVKNFQQDLSNYNFSMRESENSENDIIHKIRERDEEQRPYFYIDRKPYEKSIGWKYSKSLFIGFLVSSVLLFITLIVLFFI